MLKRLYSLGVPALITIGPAAAAAIWTLGCRANREAYYTDFIYRRHADTSLAMTQRLQSTDQALDKYTQSLVDRLSEKRTAVAAEDWDSERRELLKPIVKKVWGVKVAPPGPEEQDTPLYIHIKDGDEAEFYTNFELLTSQPSDRVFDDLIVSDQQGRVLYQQSWDAQRWDDVKFLLTKQDGKENKETK